MSQELSIFSNPEFGSVRVVMHEGDPWFIAKDVCEILGTETRDVPSILDSDEQRPLVGIIHTLNDSEGLRKDSLIVSEAGLYSLILRSRKPEAKKFKRWVTHDVLPSIRKTGGYSMTNMPDFTNPAQAARAWADEYEAKMLAQKQLKELAETVEAQEMALGDHRDWKAVTAIPWLKEYFRDTKPSTCARIGKVLTLFSKVKGFEVKKIEDPRWGKVNSYHIETINWLKDVLDREPDRLADIRIK